MLPADVLADLNSTIPAIASSPPALRSRPKPHHHSEHAPRGRSFRSQRYTLRVHASPRTCWTTSTNPSRQSHATCSPVDVRADLNGTISRSRLAPDVRQDLGPNHYSEHAPRGRSHRSQRQHQRSSPRSRPQGPLELPSSNPPSPLPWATSFARPVAVHRPQGAARLGRLLLATNGRRTAARSPGPRVPS